MFEAEIKYVAGPGFTPPGARLPEAVYRDVYYDAPDGALAASGRELRLRRMGETALLTAKAPPFDAATASKEEFEAAVADPKATAALLAALGYVERISLTKHCRRFQDAVAGLALDITVVTVDFDPRTFVEIEHLASTETEAKAALSAIRAYAAGLGLTRECRDAYTDLALAALAASAPDKP
ncbi:CYTH domain-containing protein [Desulfovibrio sp. TomC]|uniref:CYTH domain-containing protein n=1 Tax=Desulfovibrio sp. TomC TaxID=1562888 RepID=UPI0005752041|nr:CYTH domain-containing protein [Desulfovibrio sp. TomC]KHK02197.1 Phage protein [Desulfovibrio sp. TomC]